MLTREAKTQKINGLDTETVSFNAGFIVAGNKLEMRMLIARRWPKRIKIGKIEGLRQVENVTILHPQ
jgi:hypothetical protein